MATSYVEPPTLQEMVEELRIPPVLLEQTCSDDHLKSISLFLDWRRVAPHLGLSEMDIEEEIDFGKKTGSEKRLKTLQLWKGKFGYRAKYCDLVQVLLNVGNADHAERVCRLLKTAEVTLHKGDSPSSGAVTASSRQQLRITESETLSVTPISPVKTIEKEIEELEDEFLEVANEAEDFLENAVQLKKVKRCITQLPVSIRHQHIKFLQSSLTAISSAGSVSEVFTILGLYWDFLNCGLLREIIRKLGDHKTKQLMDEYSEKLRAFRERTKLGDFIHKWAGDYNFFHKEFCLEMGEEWRERTLEDLENFRIQFSRKVSFTDYAVLIRKVGTGSITVSWVLQASYPLSAALFLGALQLLRRSNVRRVTSNETVLLDLTLLQHVGPKSSSAVRENVKVDVNISDSNRSHKAKGESRIAILRGQVDEVKGVMVQNIEKVTQRGDKLEDLGERAEYQNQNADIFQRSATRRKRKLWWQNVKLWIILIIIILVVLAVIIIAIAVPLSK